VCVLLAGVMKVCCIHPDTGEDYHSSLHSEDMVLRAPLDHFKP